MSTESNDYFWVGGYVDNILVFIVPCLLYKKLFFRFVRIVRETYFLNEGGNSNELQFLNGMIEFFRSQKIDFVMQPTTNVVFNTYPDGATQVPFGSYILNLNQSEEVLWSNIHGKHRNVILNAQKKGCVVINGSDEHFDEVHKLITDTFARSGIKFMSLRKFKLQLSNLGENVKTFAVLSGSGEMQGVAVIPFSSYGAYYLHGGSIEKPQTGAVNMMHWEIIKYLKSIGVSRYDLVGARINPVPGSRLEGIQKFKMRFGAELRKGYIWKYSINKFKSRLFEFAYRSLINSSGDIIDQEKRKL